MNNQSTTSQPRIFTTGAFLKTARDSSVEGESYKWVVAEFVDDSFLEGKICLPVESASNPEELLAPYQEDE